MIITFTSLWANLTDVKLMFFLVFLFFPRKQDLTFHANCLYWDLFSGKTRKDNITSVENFTLGPVVESIVSLMSLLVVKMLTLLVSTVYLIHRYFC